LPVKHIPEEDCDKSKKNQLVQNHRLTMSMVLNQLMIFDGFEPVDDF